MTNEQNAPYEALTTVEDVHSAHDEGRAVECLPPGRTDWLRTFAYGTTVAADLAAGWQYRVALSSPPAAGDAVAWLVMYRGKPVGYATHETRDDVRLAECETLLPVFASPAAPPSVTDAMVERALSAPVRRRTVREIMALRDGADVMLMRAALEAALTHPGHKHAQECATCGGRGEIGGFVNMESGYQTDPCPECAIDSEAK